MTSSRLLLPGLFAGLALTAALVPLAAQDERRPRPEPAPEAIIYRDAGFRGPAVNVSREQPQLGLAWRVNSVRVSAGRWQICEKANYRGQCRTVDGDVLMLGSLLRGITIQSMRPLDTGGGSGGGTVPGNNPSLRGMAAEFYPAPALGGRRVLACQRGQSTASCAARTADEFCKSLGWTSSARETMETVSSRIYLADVLCSRTGN